MTPDGARQAYTFSARNRTFHATYPQNADPFASMGIVRLDTLANWLVLEPDDVVDALSWVTVEMRDYSDGAWADSGSQIIRMYNGNGDNSVDFGSGALAHETGHVVEFNMFANSDHTAWDSATALDPAPVSSYAKTNAWEDFAESWSVYQAVVNSSWGQEYRRLYPARFAVMDQLSMRVQPAVL